MVDMTIKDKMPKFMCNAETLEPFILNVRSVEYSEAIPMPEQHARHAIARVRLWFNDDVSASGDSERIDG